MFCQRQIHHSPIELKIEEFFEQLLFFSSPRFNRKLSKLNLQREHSKDTVNHCWEPENLMAVSGTLLTDHWRDSRRVYILARYDLDRPKKPSPRMHFLLRTPLSADDSFYSLDPTCICIIFFFFIFLSRPQKAILFSAGSSGFSPP